MTNPIRKARSCLIRGPRPCDQSMWRSPYWYAVCPECNAHVGNGRFMKTRKQAKDGLHHHRLSEHARPDGDSS